MNESGFWPEWCMGGMWIFPIIGISVMLLCVYLIFGRRGGLSCRNNNNDYQDRLRDSESPLEILKKRYAKGEITKEQFQEMKKEIEGNR
jgi:putative membrane protein